MGTATGHTDVHSLCSSRESLNGCLIALLEVFGADSEILNISDALPCRGQGHPWRSRIRARATRSN